MTQPTEHCGHQPDPVIGNRATECVLRPGHSGSHADKTGMRWWLADLGAEALADERHAPGVTDPTPAEQRRAAAVSAIASTLNDHDQWVSLSVREALADAVLAVATAPDPAPTERHTVDTITSDALDALYAERDRLRARVQDWRTSTGAGIRLADELRAERDALAAGVPLVCSDERHKTKVFALEIARSTAEQRAKRAEAERDQARGAVRSALPDLRRAVDCLDATCRYHGDRLDPDEYGRRYRAEACCDTGIEPRRAREARQTLDHLRAALDEHQEQPAPATHIGGNAEDCPACAGTNPPYPFICPGPKDA